MNEKKDKKKADSSRNSPKAPTLATVAEAAEPQLSEADTGAEADVSATDAENKFSSLMKKAASPSTAPQPDAPKQTKVRGV